MSNAPRRFIFDDLSDHILACRTLEVAPVMILPKATFLELATLGIAARLRRFLDAAIGPQGFHPHWGRQSQSDPCPNGNIKEATVAY
jgi:hypothetical protein